jgi:hypothetical protein
MGRKEIGRKDDVNQGWQDIVRVSEMNVPYWHRIVDGPRKVNSVFYPTLDEEGKNKTVVITVKSWENSVLAPLARIDREIQKKHIYDRLGSTVEAHEATKKVRSTLDPNSSYHCFILDKKDPVPLVHHAEYKYSVYDKIKKIEEEPFVDENGNRNEGMLRYGLLALLWLEITRSEKSESKTEYSVKVMEKYCEKFMGRIPTRFLGKPDRYKQTIDSDLGILIIHTKLKDEVIRVLEAGIMTQEELNAIVNYGFVLDDLIVPMTEDEALEKLQAYPLKLDATDDKGQFRLPDWKEIKEVLATKHLALPVIVEETPRKLSSPTVTKEKVEEPDFLVEEPEETKAKKETKKEVDAFDELFGDSQPAKKTETPDFIV